MRRLTSYLLRYRWRYALGGVYLLGTATLAMTVPYLLKRAVNAIEAGRPLSEVAVFPAAMVVAAVAQAVVRTFSRFVVFNAGRDVEYDLRNDLFAHLLRLPQAYHLEQRTGDLMSRLVNDVTAVRLLLGPGILNIVNTPIYYVYAISIMLSLDARLTLLALLPYPALLLLVKRMSREMMDRTVRVQAGLAGLSSRVQENISGMPVVKAYVRAAHEAERFSRANEEFTEESLRLAAVRGRMFPAMKVAASVGTLVVLWYGGGHVVAGRLSLGDLVAFIAYLNMLAWPTMALGWMISIVQRGRAAMQRLEEIFAAVPSIADSPGASALPAVRGDIELRHVDFAYRTAGNGHQVLHAVSIRVPAGHKLAIVGRTGAGKSTLLNLLPRLFDAGDGLVMVDGLDVRAVSLRDLRARIGMVPQDPFLFSASIKENIAFGEDEPDEARVRRAAEAAGLEPDIAAFPAGYDTVVGERGITLSGGQRQRVSLARALYVDPQVLVLDDALSSVDTRTEGRILERLRDVGARRTVVLVAHRMSAVQDADQIVVIDGGRVVEKGTHGALLAYDGVYADLFRRQRIEEEIAEL